MFSRLGDLLLAILLAVVAADPTWAQQETPSPEHRRIAQTEATGRRIELSTLKGAVLFAGPRVNPGRKVPLVIHFHGAPWLVQHHIAERLPQAVLITVQLGAGSSVYGRPFEKATVFRDLIDEAKRELKLEWSSITLTGFSAGYGAIRAILRDPGNLSRVQNVLLLDGIHASYSPEGVTLARGGKVNAIDLDSFEVFARQAIIGKKVMVITHSQIFPGSYASTTECVDHLLGVLGLNRTLSPGKDSSGMIGTTRVDRKGFHVRGYFGTTAADHVDHLHSMSEWFGFLKL